LKWFNRGKTQIKNKVKKSKKDDKSKNSSTYFTTHQRNAEFFSTTQSVEMIVFIEFFDNFM
jgi:hypothetical protein